MSSLHPSQFPPHYASPHGHSVRDTRQGPDSGRPPLGAGSSGIPWAPGRGPEKSEARTRTRTRGRRRGAVVVDGRLHLHLLLHGMRTPHRGDIGEPAAGKRIPPRGQIIEASRGARHRPRRSSSYPRPPFLYTRSAPAQHHDLLSQLLCLSEIFFPQARRGGHRRTTTTEDPESILTRQRPTRPGQVRPGRTVKKKAGQSSKAGAHASPRHRWGWVSGQPECQSQGSCTARCTPRGAAVRARVVVVGSYHGYACPVPIALARSRLAPAAPTTRPPVRPASPSVVPRRGVGPAAPPPTAPSDLLLLPVPPSRPVANYAHLPSVRSPVHARGARHPPGRPPLAAPGRYPRGRSSSSPRFALAVSPLDSPRLLPPPLTLTRTTSFLPSFQRRTTPSGGAGSPFLFLLHFTPNLRARFQNYSSWAGREGIFSALDLFLEE
ncbi:serine/arginine repetitive matrix protein 1-like [Sorghum bicolor]|uniref:serine/arginine repetitive matrix protein 1-like n=1 Tax=Sorghum bicolor TaxID=4558 RepID=UPI000B4254FE|nr:serine/arginine repetitive matrix protein 1-like [Sorghum bicolor]|eukprot:XP_021321413.1 serine/arginine repetitive matrix protein 1-like [Sorghum bicolor]